MIVAGFEFTSTTRIALVPEGLAGLGAGVVELAALSDDDGAGAEEQDRRMSSRRGIGRECRGSAGREGTEGQRAIAFSDLGRGMARKCVSDVAKA
jgi:hypothetical protein